MRHIGSNKGGGLRFRELEVFNKALLTKMAERVNKELKSLWVRVLKELYYPRGDFLSTRRGARSSWGWSSLLQGRDVLAQEGLWLVGDGTQINVHKDPWIYTRVGMRLENTAELDPMHVLKVDELITKERNWNVD